MELKEIKGRMGGVSLSALRRELGRYIRGNWPDETITREDGGEVVSEEAALDFISRQQAHGWLPGATLVNGMTLTMTADSERAPTRKPLAFPRSD